LQKEIQAPLDEILSSKGRVRILVLLSNAIELNISEIARRAGLNYATADRHLKGLEDAGLIKQKKFGRIRIYKFNDLNPRAIAIKRLVDTWK
jgi:DNA-binding transcriptional ArsR family regulator